MHHKIILVIQIIILFIFPPTLFASSLGDELLIVRGDGFWPPYEWTENNNPMGFHIDLVQSVSAKLGLKIQIKSYPWKRALRMMLDGDADAIIFVAKKKDRESFIYYREGNQLHLSKTGLIILDDKKADIQYSGDLKQFKKYTICAQQGFSYGEKFEQANYLIIDRRAKTVAQLIKMLIYNRCDLAVGYDYVKEVAKKRGIHQKLVILKPYLSIHPMYIGFSTSKKNKEIAIRFAEAMKLFKMTPRYQELLSKYHF